MSTSGPVAPVTNGTGNGSAGAQTSAVPKAPTTDRAVGPQNPVPAPGSAPVRGPDGKFTSANPKPAPVVEDDPEIELGKFGKLKRSALESELGRTRALQKQLPDWQKKIAEAESIRQSEEQRKARYKSDLAAVFEDTGLTPDDAKRLASEYLLRHHIEPEQMSPEQKRVRELEAELGKREAAEKAKQEESEKAELKKVEAEQYARLSKEVAQLIHQGKLPNSAIAAKRVVDRMKQYEDRGMEIPVEEALRLINEDVSRDTSSLLLNSPIEELQALWGPEKFKAVVDKFIAWGLAKAKSINHPAQPTRSATHSPTPGKEPMTPAQYEEWRAKNLAGRK